MSDATPNFASSGSRGAAERGPAPINVTLPPPPQRRRHWRRTFAVAVVILVAIAAAVYYGRPLLAAPAAASSVPTFRVAFGTVHITAYAKGTLEGGTADRLVAPSVGGGMPRISFLLPAGSEVKPGDVVVRFDTGQQEFNLAKAQSDAAQAAANVAAAQDQTRAQSIQNAYSLLHARDQVRLAEIAVKKNPMLPALDAKNNLLTLRSARAELTQWQQDIARQHASDQGLIAIQQVAASKAEADAAAAQGFIASMTLRAARAGYVAIQPNNGGQYFIYQGMMLQPFHVGDQVSPGSVVAEIPDLSRLRMKATLSEAGSAYVARGQPAEVQIDGVPGRVFAATIVSVSNVQNDFFGSAQGATCVLALTGNDPILRPGMDAQARIVLSDLHHVLWIPAEALFQQNGKPIVYRQQGGAFSPQPVKVLRQGSTRIAISGIPAGSIVALADPTAAPSSLSGVQP